MVLKCHQEPKKYHNGDPSKLLFLEGLVSEQGKEKVWVCFSFSSPLGIPSFKKEGKAIFNHFLPSSFFWIQILGKVLPQLPWKNTDFFNLMKGPNLQHTFIPYQGSRIYWLKLHTRDTILSFVTHQCPWKVPLAPPLPLNVGIPQGSLLIFHTFWFILYIPMTLVTIYILLTPESQTLLPVLLDQLPDSSNTTETEEGSSSWT